MENRKKIAQIVRWTARIWGALILAFLLFFLLAHIFGNDESGEGFRSVKEVISFILFPIGAIVGLGVALKWEGLGGLITVGAMILFFMLMPEMIFNPYTAIVLLAGLLYIIHHFVFEY